MTDYDKIFNMACLAGVLILENGGETYRAEETALRICSTVNATADVLAMPTGLFMSFDVGDFHASKAMRVKKRCINLQKVNEVNTVSRKFLAGEMDIDQAYEAVENLNSSSKGGKLLTVLFAGLSSFFFAFLFGGGLFDSIISFMTSCVVQAIISSFKRTAIFHFTSNFITGFVISIFALSSVALFNMGNFEAIIVGAILPYLPGLATLNALKDTMMGDLVSGTARLGEALLSAVSLATGVGLVFAVYIQFGGVIA